MKKLSLSEPLNFLAKRDSNENSKSNSNFRKLIAGLITPEWFFSKSTKILINNHSSWNTFTSLDKEILGKFNHIDIEYKDYFEKSFSSWYQPYHLMPRDTWGIHVRRDSIKRISSRFFQSCNQYKNERDLSIKAGFLYIFFHHLYHHMIENMITFMEKRYNKPNLYRTYYNEKYARCLHSSFCLEEILSIEYIFERFKEVNLECLKNELASSSSYDFDFKFNRVVAQRDLVPLILSNSKELLKSEIDEISRYTDIENYDEYDLPVWIHGVPKPVSDMQF